MKTTRKEEFFSILALYWEGRHFSCRRFEIVKLDKIVDTEMDFRITPVARSALQSNSNFMNKIEATI